MELTALVNILVVILISSSSISAEVFRVIVKPIIRNQLISD